MTTRGVTTWKSPLKLKWGKDWKNEKLKKRKIEKMKNWKMKNDGEWLEEEFQVERPPKKWRKSRKNDEKWGKNWKMMGSDLKRSYNLKDPLKNRIFYKK